MRAKIWGCRGSLAAPGPETVRYRGNTSCVEVRPSDDRLLVIDAGTGIRNLGVGLGRDYPARVATYFSPPLFPVHIDEIPAHMVFHDVPENEWELGPARIRGELVKHPGPTLGYRVEDGGRVLTYISDHEPALGIDLETVPPDWISGYSIAERADVLLHDAQYTEEEYPHRVGWGHSSIAHTVTFGLIAKVQRLLMFHHDPLHSDAQLEAMLVRARELWDQDRDGLAISFEGMEIDIS